MLHFPITFTISIINIWLKLIPNLSQKQNENEEYSKEEIEGMLQARHAVKDLVQSLCNHLKSLHDYLSSIMKQKPLQLNFTLIRKNCDKFTMYHGNPAKRIKLRSLRMLDLEKIYLESKNEEFNK